MKLLSGVYKDGVIEPSKKLHLKNGESVKITILSGNNNLVTNKTYGTIRVSNHNLLESIIEETKYGSKRDITANTV